ncbi:MAG: SDR family oxidoreductase [bacterium]|nr:SDR family oxidoreductase [bacterium]
MEVDGARILVTGAARRVGRAIAWCLAQAGADIAIHYRDSKDEAAALGEQITAAGGTSCLIRGDLADRDGPQQIIAATADALGGLDVLVNNAAVFSAMTLGGFDADDWDRTLQVNLTAVAALCQHARPLLEANAGGSIVNLCDIAADRPWPGYLAYCVSKAGLVCLTQALARELAPKVRVNGVSPGIAAFPDDYDASRRGKLIAKVPLGRAGTPEDVAEAVQFLVSNDYITGQIIRLDGGRSLI